MDINQLYLCLRAYSPERGWPPHKFQIKSVSQSDLMQMIEYCIVLCLSLYLPWTLGYFGFFPISVVVSVYTFSGTGWTTHSHPQNLRIRQRSMRFLLQVWINIHIWYEEYTEIPLSECTPGWSLCGPLATRRASKTCVWTLRACDGTWQVSARQHSWHLSSWDIRAPLITNGNMESDGFAAARAKQGALIKLGLLEAQLCQTC